MLKYRSCCLSNYFRISNSCWWCKFFKPTFTCRKVTFSYLNLVYFERERKGFKFNIIGSNGLQSSLRIANRSSIIITNINGLRFCMHCILEDVNKYEYFPKSHLRYLLPLTRRGRLSLCFTLPASEPFNGIYIVFSPQRN